jgi:hypothetical protein
MRDPSILLWPDTFAPASMNVVIDRPRFKGPKPLDGREQVVASSAGGWLINYEGVSIYGDLYRSFRSIWLETAARAKPVYISPEFSPNMLARRNGISPVLADFDQVGTVKNVLEWGTGELLWSVGEPLFWGSSGSGWSDFQDSASFTQSTGDCYLSSSAARGAVTISVSNSAISAVKAGDYFEINGRLHLVQGIYGNSWDIWPPLRGSYAAGTQLEIDDPRMLSYVVSDSRSYEMPIQPGNVSHISIDFIEANW